MRYLDQGLVDRRRRHRQKREEGFPVTVCVAALCEGYPRGMIVGASDRLVTAGDIQAEPLQTKIYQLTSSIAIMVSGDNLLNDEILKRVTADTVARIAADPEDWIGVEEVADLYRKYYQDAFLKRVENDLLAPLNLDRDTWITQQRLLKKSLVHSLAKDILNFEPSPEGVEVIVAGVDTSGAHLYVVGGSDVSCWDSSGYAAIGKGYWHAQSQMMFAGHTSARPAPEVVLDVYFAKKRAEVAPNVGKYTDMFTIGPALGTFLRAKKDFVDLLDGIYEATKDREHQVRLAAQGDLYERLKESSAQRAQVQEATPEDGIGSAIEGQDAGRDAAEEPKPED